MLRRGTELFRQHSVIQATTQKPDANGHWRHNCCQRLFQICVILAFHADLPCGRWYFQRWVHRIHIT